MAVAGLLLFALPAFAVTTKHQKLHEGTSLRLDITNIELDTSGLVPRIVISTPINQISTSQLTGENKFVVTDHAYVFLSPGPIDIWYPYAISKRPPAIDDTANSQLVLAGKVTNITRDSLAITYGFETFYPPSTIAISNNAKHIGHIEIVIDDQGRATLRTLNVGESSADQRNLFKWAPPG